MAHAELARARASHGNLKPRQEVEKKMDKKAVRKLCKYLNDNPSMRCVNCKFLRVNSRKARRPFGCRKHVARWMVVSESEIMYCKDFEIREGAVRHVIATKLSWEQYLNVSSAKMESAR